jgi:hypothetical protein
MRIHTLRLTSCLAALLSLLSSGALAQFSQRGGISGVVTDGAVVPQASMTLLDLGRSQTSTISTDVSGHYEFSQLLSGTYQVSVELAVFKKSVSEFLPVSPQSAVRYDFQLHVGSASEPVEVTTAAPLLQTQSLPTTIGR